MMMTMRTDDYDDDIAYDDDCHEDDTFDDDACVCNDDDAIIMMMLHAHRASHTLRRVPRGPRDFEKYLTRMALQDHPGQIFIDITWAPVITYAS